MSMPERTWRDGRYKIPEGIGLTEWPEFRALARRLGVAVPKDASIVLDYQLVGNVTMTVNGSIVTTKALGREAFHWSESIAYFRRLGLPYEQWVIDLKIEFAPGVFPTYTMRAALTDNGEQ